MSSDPPLIFGPCYATVDINRGKNQFFLCIVNVDKGVVEPNAHVKNHFFDEKYEQFHKYLFYGSGLIQTAVKTKKAC